MVDTGARLVAASVGVIALAAVSGCAGGAGSVADGDGAAQKKEKTTFSLGQASPPQESTMQSSSGATYTVTPLKVTTGTQADLNDSGLEKDESDGPQIPVFVWSTLTHTGGKSMELGDMDDDLVVRTTGGQRARPLIVLMGSAKWPDCPGYDTSKVMSKGASEKVCTAFLVPAGQKPAAIEVTRGFYKKPLEWPVAS
ncbi:hypothetical protein ABZ896_19945 [Streptomyces sp. NPDC047072]|uniref:hypothetical protein n=1 Tax=Streptomyces sp. NPDC047072 TaxID=3154809 RepID=UPI0033E1641F